MKNWTKAIQRLGWLLCLTADSMVWAKSSRSPGDKVKSWDNSDRGGTGTQVTGRSCYWAPSIRGYTYHTGRPRTLYFVFLLGHSIFSFFLHCQIECLLGPKQLTTWRFPPSPPESMDNHHPSLPPSLATSWLYIKRLLSSPSFLDCVLSGRLHVQNESEIPPGVSESPHDPSVQNP